MVGCMLLIALVLSLTTALASWLSGKMGGDKNFRARFVELGYQYAPVAMVSLIIGLGAALFEPFTAIHAAMPGMSKLVLFVGSILWSLWLGWKILAHQGLNPPNRLLPLLPGLLGSLAVGAAWWPGIFGL